MPTKPYDGRGRPWRRQPDGHSAVNGTVGEQPIRVAFLDSKLRRA